MQTVPIQRRTKPKPSEAGVSKAVERGELPKLDVASVDADYVLERAVEIVEWHKRRKTAAVAVAALKIVIECIAARDEADGAQAQEAKSKAPFQPTIVFVGKPAAGQVQ